MAPERFSYVVVLPDRRTGGLGAAAPRGTIMVRREDGSDTSFTVPGAVSRILFKQQQKATVQPASYDELRRLVDTTCVSCAKSRVLRLVTRRDYAEAELRDKLFRDGYEASVVDQVIDTFKQTGIVSDQRFAQTFVRSKLAAGWGVERIVRELRSRNIDAATLDGWPYDYLDPEDEAARAKEVARRKHLTGPNAYAKLVRFLVGRGFTYGIAREAAASVLSADE